MLPSFSCKGILTPLSNIKFSGTDGNRTVTINPAQNVFGSSEIMITVSDDDNAMAATQFSVVIHAKPDADFNVANNCDYEMTVFDNESAINSGHIVDYAWDFADGTSDASQNPSHFYGAAGIYNVSLITTSNYGCLDTASTSLEIYAKPTADFFVNDVCYSEVSLFVNTSSLGAEYLWDFGDDWGISTLESPEYLFSEPSQYMTSLFVTSAQGCRDTITKTTSVFALPTAAFSVENHCFNEEFSPVDESTGTLTDHNWEFGDGNSSTEFSPTHDYADGTFEEILKRNFIKLQTHF